MEDASGKTAQRNLVIVSLVLTILGTFIVVGRVLTRLIIVRNAGRDDYTMVGALVITIVYLTEICLMSKYGIGLPKTETTLEQVETMMKITLGIEITYFLAIYLIKISIILFYLRIGASRTFQILCKATIIVLTIFACVFVIVELAQCQPLHKLWDFTGLVKGTCINVTAFFYSTSAFNIVTDLWILCLPIKALRSIQRPIDEKVALFAIFGVGIFAWIASIVRLHTISLFTLSKDPFRHGIKVNLWSMIEINTAIFCASIPALKPLLSRSQREKIYNRHALKSGGYNHGINGDNPRENRLTYNAIGANSRRPQPQELDANLRGTFQWDRAGSEQDILYPLQELQIREAEFPSRVYDGPGIRVEKITSITISA